MTRLLLVVAALAAALLAPGIARAASALAPCPGKPGVECGTINVPLDRSGVTPGTVPIYVERAPANGFEVGTIFLVAGGPGQASARSFDLESSARDYQTLFPGYALVAFDPRGTGNSGVLRCPALQAATDADTDTFARLAAGCANQIGPTRVFYATRDHAEDIDAVREALGLRRVALWGTSYGTKLLVAYALAHPGRVERLLLDSVLRSDGPDVFASDTLQAIPSGLASICAGGGCRGVTANPGRDVARLANALNARPIRGPVVQANGKRIVERVDGLRLISLVVDADISPGIASALPSAVATALAGRTAPLLRLAELDESTFAVPDVDLSFGLNAATVCADGLFPWEPSTPTDQRNALLDAAIGALPAGATGPFGSWAALSGTAAYCELWPSPAGRTPLATGPLPDVPVLALAGDIDMRTQTAAAVDVASRFPQGRVLTVPGVGHSVLGADFSGCTARAVQLWMNGATPPQSCPRVQPLIPPIGRLPGKLSAFPPGGRGLSGRTLSAVASTVREAESTWLIRLFSGDSRSVGGVISGRLTPSRIGNVFTLSRYRDVAGVDVTGQLNVLVPESISPLGLSGRLTVTGRGSAHGTLTLQGGVLSGRLGGRKVSLRLAPAAAAAAQSSSVTTSLSTRPSSNSWPAR